MTRHLTVGILLAAGSGHRFDPTGTHNKLLQMLDGGETVVAQSARHMLEELSVVVAVTNSAQMMQILTNLGCDALLCSDAQQGMGTSLAHAAAHVQSNYPDVRSVLIGLADMPFVNPASIRSVVQQLANEADIVQPTYLGRRGHPVGFAGRHIDDLKKLHGDVGARHLLDRFLVQRLPVEDPGVIRDIDLRSDLPNTIIS